MKLLIFTPGIRENNFRLRAIVRVNRIGGIAIVIIGVIVLLSLFTNIKL